EELKKQYLGMLTEDFKLASFCLTEPDAGSDVSGMRTTAVRKGDKYVINGSKCFITNGGYADWFTVYAKTDKDAGHRGISCFIVPKDDTVTVDKKEDKMGQRASNTATITFNETEIPADHLIGEENKGFKIAMMTLDRTRPGVAAMATGIARAAFEFATNYSKERVQFGVPIAMHQAIQFMIADMATKVHLSRLATWNSAVLLDQGRRNTLESSHAKRFAADTAMEVTTDAVQIYGGYGFIKEYPVEKLMRDAKTVEVEDEKIHGRQTVGFEPNPGGPAVSLELDYAIKQDRGVPAVVDFVFVRRPMRDSLKRTLQRFEREVRAPADL